MATFPPTLVQFVSLLKNHRKQPEEIRSIQERKLRKLIRHAYDKVPYYRELFNSNKIEPQDIQTLKDLETIPLTSKKQLQDLALEDKLSEGIDPLRCKSFSTSGTTGIPLVSYFTPHDSTLKNLSWIRTFKLNDLKPWHKMAAFIGQKQTKKKRSWYEHFGLWRRREISSWKSTEDWVAEILQWKPDVLIGYVMTLRILAEAIQDKRIEGIKPKMIFHSSALLDSYSQAYIESVFQTKVTDIYGSDEAGCIAWSCGKCGGYHICSDMVIVEALNKGERVRPGQHGEAVITNLHSYAMPFIRYKQEDIITLSRKEPVCGTNFPLLERIDGRMDDFIILKNGTKLSPHPFYHSIDPVPGVNKWRIVQDRGGQISVELETAPNFDTAGLQTIKNNLNQLVKGELEIRIIPRDSLPIDPSTKFRTVSSKLNRNTHSND